jgi:hypothetical protein
MPAEAFNLSGDPLRAYLEREGVRLVDFERWGSRWRRMDESPPPRPSASVTSSANSRPWLRPLHEVHSPADRTDFKDR